MFDVEALLFAYKNGIFPMADNDAIGLYSADPRAVFSIYSWKPHKSLVQFMKKQPISFTINSNFPIVIKSCANRNETWISEELIEDYCKLHLAGYAHSIEVWQEAKIVGGLYGVAIGGAFFGESMFNFVPNAAKIAFYFLIEQLKKQNFMLLDSQFINDFTKQLGAIEIPNTQYLQLLNEAITLERSFI